MVMCNVINACIKKHRIKIGSKLVMWPHYNAGLWLGFPNQGLQISAVYILILHFS